MVTEADMKKTIERWKRGTRALKTFDQHHGENLVKMLERYSGPQLKIFDDSLEAATFALLVGLLRELDTKDRELPDGYP